MTKSAFVRFETSMPFLSRTLATTFTTFVVTAIGDVADDCPCGRFAGCSRDCDASDGCVCDACGCAAGCCCAQAIAPTSNAVLARKAAPANLPQGQSSATSPIAVTTK